MGIIIEYHSDEKPEFIQLLRPCSVKSIIQKVLKILWEFSLHVSFLILCNMETIINSLFQNFKTSLSGYI